MSDSWYRCSECGRQFQGRGASTITAVLCSKKCRDAHEARKQKKREQRQINYENEKKRQELKKQQWAESKAIYLENIADGKKLIALAMIFNIFLGIFGVHYFYLGHKARGKSYAFSLGWVFVGVIIDFVYLPILYFKNKCYQNTADFILFIVYALVIGVAGYETIALSILALLAIILVVILKIVVRKKD